MPLIILRIVFLVVAAGIGVQLVQTEVEALRGVYGYLAFAGVMLIAISVIAIDIAVRRKRLEDITAIYFGLIIGLFLTYVVQLALSPYHNTAGFQWVPMILGMILCYTCISVLMQTKNDFRFIIPYVEFAKEIKGLKPLVLDTSVVIDGRIADVTETGVFDNQLIMP